jgi:hypothetical protein
MNSFNTKILSRYNVYSRRVRRLIDNKIKDKDNTILFLSCLLFSNSVLLLSNLKKLGK